MTKLLCLDDAYLKTAKAMIVKKLQNGFVLNQTIFYPQGGGQPGDTGTISRNGETIKVTDTKKVDGEVVHILKKVPEWNEGNEVELAIDWSRRFNFMRMHTSAHVLAGIINQMTGKLITGNQLGETQSRMDFEVEKFDQEFLNEIQEKVNEVLQQELDIKVSALPREEAMKIPSLFRLKDVLPKNLEVFRIVSIGDFDVQADGGTHPHNTREVGKIKITKHENKGAQNRRIYWELEE